MKKLLLPVILLFSIIAVSQEIFFETGKVSSDFQFTNSNNVQLDNLNKATNTYITAGYKHRFFTDEVNVSLALAHNSYGAIGSDNAQGNFFQYDVDFLDVTLGFDYGFYTWKDITVIAKGSFSYGFATQGTQTLNNQVFDLFGQEEFQNGGIFLRGGLAFQYPIVEKVSIYIQYMYGQSSGLNDQSGGSDQDLKIDLNSFGFGLNIALPHKKKLNKEKVATEEDLN